MALTDPVYPVYCDSNVMAGRTGEAEEDGSYTGLVYMPCTAANNFTPEIPTGHADIIYLCSPNNPTGTMITKDEMTRLRRELRDDILLVIDAAYAEDTSGPKIVIN